MTKLMQNVRLLAALGFAGTLAACASGATPPPASAPSGTSPTTARAAGAAASARQAPPAAMPLGAVEFPAFREMELPNGLQLVVVERTTQPVASVNLYVRAGSASDPATKAGTAELVADLLTKGTASRSATQISESIERVGGSVNASADPDFTNVSATVLAENLPLAMKLVSDAVIRPSFPATELETSRTRYLSGLQASLAQPGVIAQRQLASSVYGSHPYAISETPVSVRAISRADLAAFHRANFSPRNALLVVSGDVRADEVETLARRWFGGWTGGQVPRVNFAAVAAPAGTRIHLVNRPGSVQSNILVGGPGIRPDNPDYYPLQVLNKLLGGGTDARLFTILREQKGWTYGSYTQLSRPRDVGTFVASAEVRTEVTDSALAELMNQLRRVRDEAVTAGELEAAKGFLVGSFPVTIETPGQIASQVARTRLLGLPIDALTGYRQRIQAVTAADVQRVARQYVRPDQSVIVVVGDAPKIVSRLEALGRVALYDTEGKLLQRSALEVRASGERFDASRLRPGTLTYRVLVQGNPFGTATTALTKQGEQWVGTSNVQLGPLTQRGETRFTSQLVPISTRQSTTGPVQTEVDLRFANGKVTGTAKMPAQAGGDKNVDAAVVAGTILPGMDEYILAVADLQPGKTIAVPVFSVRSGAVVNQSFKVTGSESVTTPAGTFQTYRLEVSGGDQGFVVFVRQDLPHIAVKQEYTGQPVVLELQSIQ